jgi:hypothetical protein
MLIIEDYLKNQQTGVIQKCSDDLMKNATDLLEKVNSLLIELQYFNTDAIEIDNLQLIEYIDKAIITSGYRDAKYNQMIGGSNNSAHSTCQAVDLSDKEGILRKMILNNISLLKKYELYMEHPRYTKTWCHLSTRRTKSGLIVFIPYQGEPNAKHLDTRFPLLYYNYK